MHHHTAPDNFDQFFIHRAGSLGQTLVGLTPATAAHLQTEGIIERFTHFGVRPTQTMLQISRQGLGTRSHQHPRRSGSLGCLLRMPRTHPLMTIGTVATVGHIAGRDQRDDLWNIRHILLMLVNIPQPAPTLRATMQLGLFGSIDLPVRRWLPPGKLSLPSFPPRLLRMLLPFPTRKRRRLAFACPLQLFHFRLQPLQQLLQTQIVQAQSLILSPFPHQFQLQFGHPVGLAVRLPRRFLVGSAHATKSTGFALLSIESFGLISPAI